MITNKLNVENKDKELILSRVFDAPPKTLFSVWSSCEHLKHWWGPKEWPMKECNMEFQEGGQWHYCLRGPNKEDESWGIATYLEIVENKKITYRDNFSDAEGNVNKEMPELLISVEFIEQDGQTKWVSTTQTDSSETLNQLVEMGMVEGMSSSLERLIDYLEKM